MVEPRLVPLTSAVAGLLHGLTKLAAAVELAERFELNDDLEPGRPVEDLSTQIRVEPRNGEIDISSLAKELKDRGHILYYDPTNYAEYAKMMIRPPEVLHVLTDPRNKKHGELLLKDLHYTKNYSGGQEFNAILAKYKLFIDWENPRWAVLVAV